MVQPQRGVVGRNRTLGAVALFVALTLAGCLDTSPPPAAAADSQPEPEPPVELVLSFSPVNPAAGDEVRFSLDQSPSGPVLWDFDDGTSAVHPAPRHAFREAGHYDVTVRTEVDGRSATGVVRVPVSNAETGETPEEPEQPPEQPPAEEPPEEPAGNETSPPSNETEPSQNETEQGGYHGFDGEPEDCSKLLFPGPFEVSAEVVTGFETRVLDIVVLVDTSFVRVHGENWRDSVDFIVAKADEVYQREVQLAVEIVAVYEIPADYLDLVDTNHVGTTGPASEESRLILDQSRRYMDDFHGELDRDLVYTFVGASVAGSIAGQAECIGGARYKDAAYGWGEADELNDGQLIGPTGWFHYSGIKVIIHEIGHILGAHHHYQECGTPITNSIPHDLLGACSIMTNVVDFASFQFSNLNKMAIRGWAEEVDL